MVPLPPVLGSLVPAVAEVSLVPLVGFPSGLLDTRSLWFPSLVGTLWFPSLLCLMVGTLSLPWQAVAAGVVADAYP